ncbi:MAG: 1-acyl-sn-glycerol-3-phosphate acyltransferase [Pseudomonadales bacterium]|nr:1-acyl-sn-glycerol-3-phosphate acyltransferase [Pseudomonadales bacterium]
MTETQLARDKQRSGPPLYFFYRWLILAPMLALSTAALGSIITLVSFLGAPDWASRVFGTFWARLNMAVSFMSLEREGEEKIAAGQSYVVVANHQSLVDIYVIYGYLPLEIKWVMKQELRAVPVLGMACEAMGHIIIDRSNTEAALKSINDARHRIQGGISVVFFPEGTRSRTGALGQFKKGAFRLAQELQLPILPVTIHNTRRVLPSDGTAIVPGKVRLEIHDPIETKGAGPADVARLVNKCREVIAKSLEGEV